MLGERLFRRVEMGVLAGLAGWLVCGGCTGEVNLGSGDGGRSDAAWWGDAEARDARWDAGWWADATRNDGSRIDGFVGPDAAIPDAGNPDAGATCDLPAPGNHTMSLTVDGVQRTYILHVPSGVAVPAPMLVALHGNGDTAGNFLAYSQLGAAADANGFLLVVPQAISGSGPQGVDWDAYTEPPSANKDYRFVQEIRLTWQACTDSHRFYVLGYSQGGFLAFYVGMKDSTVVAAIHVQSAANPDGSSLINGAARKIPVQMRIGTEDFLIDVARQTRDALNAAGFPLDYEEIPNHGHCCYLSSLNDEIWAFLSSHPLP